MTPNTTLLFEEELKRRGLPFELDAGSGRHVVSIHGTRLFISLENLRRDVLGDGDTGRVSRFVDSLVDSGRTNDTPLSAANLHWCLEPADHREKADFRVPMSDLVDRVLVHLSDDGKKITWVTPPMLAELGLTKAEAEARAFANLSRALGEAKVEFRDIEGVKLGMLATTLPFKSALIIAPNLKEVVGTTLGWPLLAVVPNRNFLFLWDAARTDFAGRMGGVVVDNHAREAYPISTEVYRTDDAEIRAIGAFPARAS